MWFPIRQPPLLPTWAWVLSVKQAGVLYACALLQGVQNNPSEGVVQEMMVQGGTMLDSW